MKIRVYHHSDIEIGSIEISEKTPNEICRMLKSGKYKPIVNVETDKATIIDALNEAFIKTVSISGPWWKNFNLLIEGKIRNTDIGDIMSIVRDKHEEFYMTRKSGFRRIV